MIPLLKNIIFVNPLFLFLLLLLPIFIIWRYRKYKKRYSSLRLSHLRPLEDIPSLRGKLRALLPALRMLALAGMIIALARPQNVLEEQEIKAEGIDIMLVMDLSSSMLARDFNPDRLQVSKKVAGEFVEKRKYDRIGLAVFAGESFTQCPLTTDHSVLKAFLEKLECGLLEDGTAIGEGSAVAVNRLKESEAKSKIVILLTDGVNNSGYIQPITAAQIAREFNIKVYTIGVGSTGDALAPVSRRSDGRYVFGLTPVEIDEDLLIEIADMTGGKYFRATSAEALERIYAEIDQLEKTEIEISILRRYSEAFHPFAFFSIICLVLEFLLRYTVLRAIP